MKKKMNVLLAISMLMMIVSSPHQLEGCVNAAGSGIAFLRKAYIRLDNAVKDFAGHQNAAVASAILGGIMIMIIGFATLVIGNYIIYAIIDSLPILNSTNYNNTRNAIIGYANTVIPLFGLGLMVLGFAIILHTLRASMDTSNGQR